MNNMYEEGTIQEWSIMSLQTLETFLLFNGSFAYLHKLHEIRFNIFFKVFVLHLQLSHFLKFSLYFLTAIIFFTPLYKQRCKANYICSYTQNKKWSTLHLIPKAELLQEGILFRTQFPSLRIFMNKKVGFRKN